MMAAFKDFCALVAIGAFFVACMTWGGLLTGSV
jgi:hypothetical protein